MSWIIVARLIGMFVLLVVFGCSKTGVSTKKMASQTEIELLHYSKHDEFDCLLGASKDSRAVNRNYIRAD